MSSFFLSFSLSLRAEYPLLDRERFKGLLAIQGGGVDCAVSVGSSCLSSQLYRGMGCARVCRKLKRDYSFHRRGVERRSRSRNVITSALNLFEVHCEVRRDSAEVLMATRDPIHLHREACLAPTLSASCRMLRRDYRLPFANYEREKARRDNGEYCLMR